MALYGGLNIYPEKFKAPCKPKHPSIQGDIQLPSRLP